MQYFRNQAIMATQGGIAMPSLDFDSLWDYEHPEQTEAAFHQLLSQIARTQIGNKGVENICG